MKKVSLIVSMALLLPAAGFAQAPAAATVAGRVAVLDFQRAVTENADGKKAQEKFMAEFTKRQSEFEAKQKSMAEMQTKLQTAEKALSENAKADLAKQIDRTNTELQRMNDDAQKELGEMQQQLFQPIAARVQEAVKSYGSENGFSVVFDLSSQASSIVYHQDVADITTEIIRRVDASAAKAPAAPPTKPTPPPAK
jgi:outer membrane protein